MDTKTLYNVYIVNKETRKAVKIIGRMLSENRADKCVMYGLMTVNDGYFIADEVMDSEQDIEYQFHLATA